MSWWGSDDQVATEPKVKLVGLSNLYTLSDAVTASGVKAGFKPTSAQVTKLKLALEQLPWPKNLSKGACVITAWLGGVRDACGDGEYTQAAQDACGEWDGWGLAYTCVSEYLAQIKAWSPDAYAVLQSAGTASAKAAADSIDTQEKQDIKKVKEKTKEAVKDAAETVVDTVATGLKIASFGLGSLAIVALVVAAIVYLPKRA